MNLDSMWLLQGTMFLLVVTGFLMRKKNIFPPETKGVMTDMVLSLILPCNIVTSFRSEFNADVLGKLVTVLIVGVCAQIVSYLVNMAAYNKYEPGKKKVFQYGTLVSNAGFLGNPVAEGVYGSIGLMYASVYCIPLRVVMWSAGIALFTDKTDKKAAVKKVVLHPCMIGLYLGLFLMITGISLPGFVENTVTMVGRCTTPLTMLLIGCFIAGIEDFRSVFTPDILYFCAIRIVLIPLILFMGCRLFHVDSVITGTSVLLASMPAGSTTAILAAKYGGDYVFGTKLVVFSTLLTLLSIPVWCLVLM